MEAVNVKVTFLRAWAKGTWDLDTVEVPSSIPYPAIESWYCDHLEEYPRRDSKGIVLVAIFLLGE